MGTWDKKNFGNDDALDFVDSFGESNTSQLELLLKKITDLPSDSYLEASDCFVALVVCEIIAAQKGKSSEDFPEDFKNTISDEDIDNLAELAILAVDRIVSNSELKDLWEESEEYTEWLAVQENLKERLQ